LLYRCIITLSTGIFFLT